MIISNEAMRLCIIIRIMQVCDFARSLILVIACLALLSAKSIECTRDAIRENLVGRVWYSKKYIADVPYQGTGRLQFFTTGGLFKELERNEEHTGKWRLTEMLNGDYHLMLSYDRSSKPGKEFRILCPFDPELIRLIHKTNFAQLEKETVLKHQAETSD